MPVSLRGNSPRKPVNFTLEEDIFAEFRQICNKKAINRSLLLEKLILDWMENNKNNKV